MGVEPRADVVCLPEPPREKGGIRISHSAYKLRKTTSVWMSIWRGSGLVVAEGMDLIRGVNDDVIVIYVRRRCETITRMVNIYD
jgi:hypothetical protein